MNIIFSDQNCLSMGITGPGSQFILGHTDVLINDKHFFVNANTCSFKTINKDNSNDLLL